MKFKGIEKATAAALFGVVLFGVISIILLFKDCLTEDVVIWKEDGILLSEGWTLNGEDVSFPVVKDVEAGEELVFQCQLPDDIPQYAAIYYNGIYCIQETYIGDECVYTFGTQKAFSFSRQMVGSAYALIPLDEEDSGQTLSIHMTNPFGDTTVRFEGVYYGSAGEFKFAMLKTNVWRMVFVVLVLFTAVFMFVAGIVHVKTEQDIGHACIFGYFSLFAASLAVWVGTDSTIVQFYTGKMVAMQFLAFISIIFIGAFYSGICACLLPEYLLAFHIVEMIGYALFAVILVCFVTGVAEPHQFLYPIYGYAFLTLLLSMIITIRCLRIHFYSWIMLVGGIVLITGTCMAIYMFIKNPLGANAVMPVVIAFGIYIVGLFTILMRYEERLMVNSIAKGAYQKLAYTDKLTGLSNRAAYEQLVDQIEENSEPHNIVLFMGDLNYLKRTNDNMGHEAGDRLIIAAAKCFEETFTSAIRPFRMGGDEFATILIDPQKAPEDYCKLLQERVEEYNKENHTELSIAMSYASCMFPSEGRDIRHSLYIEADMKMYEEKKKMKIER